MQAQSRHKADKTEGKRIVGRERAVTSHARPFSLAVEVDQIEQVATLEDGLLRLTLPQRGTPRTVQIKAA